MIVSPTRKKIAALALSALVAVMLLSLLRARQSRNPALSDPISVGPVIESVYGIGTVTANHTFLLRSGITTQIQNLFVREGDLVKRGQKLVLAGEGVLSTAPFEGTVTSVPVKIGENVFPQTVILSLVDLNDRYVIASLEQRAAIRVKRGQKARLSFDELRERPFDGIVESVYSNDNNFFVRIDVRDLPDNILPGMTADVAIEIAARRDALLIPAAALSGDEVLVKRGRRRPATVKVKIGVVDGAMAEVTGGDIRPGDRLLLRTQAPK